MCSITSDWWWSEQGEKCGQVSHKFGVTQFYSPSWLVQETLMALGPRSLKCPNKNIGLRCPNSGCNFSRKIFLRLRVSNRIKTESMRYGNRKNVHTPFFRRICFRYYFFFLGHSVARWHTKIMRSKFILIKIFWNINVN